MHLLQLLLPPNVLYLVSSRPGNTEATRGIMADLERTRLLHLQSSEVGVLELHSVGSSYLPPR